MAIYTWSYSASVSAKRVAADGWQQAHQAQQAVGGHLHRQVMHRRLALLSQASHKLRNCGNVLGRQLDQLQGDTADDLG